jgi:hypothetical protein
VLADTDPCANVVVVVDASLFAAMASTMTTGESSTDDNVVLDDEEDDDDDAVVAAEDELSVDGVVGELVVNDSIMDGGIVGNCVTEEVISGVVVSTTVPFINCPWEGVSNPHTTLTYMSNVSQLFNLSSVAHSPLAAQSSPRPTSRQFGISVLVGQ